MTSPSDPSTAEDLAAAEYRREVDYWGQGRSGPAPGEFLAGPRSRWSESAELLKIVREFVNGFRSLHFVGPCVTVFGSARFPDDHPYCQLARATAAELARVGFAVMTGGGPGIMEAANRGAREAGGLSLGATIKLPHEEAPNPYLDRTVAFDYFFVRKVILVKYSYGFIVLPGGFGTLDEVFNTVTLIQTLKIKDFPIVLMGSDYWRPLVGFMRDTMVAHGTISARDPDLMTVTDEPGEAVRLISGQGLRKFGLRWQPRPLRVLGERGLRGRSDPS
ncbi:MAG: TIGR00730 family Rossman fold protein [Ardenticatenia bacterium]|nr:TIGR00730 family Rossman fold protein [Ardenticatenia bacterium]